MTNLEKIRELKEEIARLQGRIEEIEKSEQKSSRWKPELGEVYWFISGHGGIVYAVWQGNREDIGRYAIGNIFPTKEAAEFEAERLRVIAEMQEFAFVEQSYSV